MLERDEQPKKADLPISFTVVGIVMLERDEHL